MSQKRKNTGAKIMAFLALFAIVVGIFGTAILFIVSSISTQKQDQTLSPEDLQKLIESYTGSQVEAT